ncbi:MAG: hypothetical protein DLM52_03075 [Chthoniobacterales bacterium]|nr:MAG: hypothetical protein DLM52_03075 [Chthoniobacterales bacterium]
MKAKLISAFIIAAPLAQSFACQACFGNYNGVAGGPPKNVEHMAMAIWVLMFVVGSVLGGIGAFSLHLWRRSRMPLQPHEQLAEEDFSQYA